MGGLVRHLLQLRPRERKAVRAIWEAWQSGRAVSAETLREVTGAECPRVRDIFKTNGVVNPAWGSMIVRADGQKDVYTLKAPEEKA